MQQILIKSNVPERLNQIYDTPGRFSLCSISIFLIFLNQCLANDLSIEFSGNTFFSSAYLTADFSGARNERDVEDFIEGVLIKYSDAGFPFCRISPEIIYQNNTVEKIMLNIDEGERVLISDYLFDVEGKTETAAIKKIMRLQTDKYFSSKQIAWSKSLLLKTNAFEEINDNIIFRDDEYYILFNITEKRSDYVTALGSFAGENFKENFNFGITFFSLNLLGTLRRLQFRYEYKKLFSLEFTEPILIAPSVFDINFSLWTYDSVRLAEFNGTFTAPLGRYFSISLTTGIEAVSYYDEDIDAGQRIDNLVGLGFGLDYRKQNWACSQAINFEYLFRDFDRRSVKYDGELDVGSLVVKPHYYWTKTDSFEFFDYFRIGGARDLRGYLEEEFIVPKALWLNVEYRKFFLSAIFDIGLIGDDILYSYGFGIVAESDFADASLTLAWPKGGRWRDGKVHLLFEKGF